MPSTAELNLLDQLYLHLDRHDEPWGVHFEVGVGDHLDEQRLAGAVMAAADRHPIARARLAAWRGTDVRYRWEIPDRLDRVPLEVAECADETARSQVRERLLGVSPPLDTSPPFAIALAHHAAGDSVILNLHHAAGDGMSAMRLMISILRAYAGEEDPLPAIDPLAVRDIPRLAGAGSLGERVTRTRTAIEDLGRFDAPTRVAADGGVPRAGYGFELLRLDRDEMQAVLARRGGRATVNDVLVAALALTVRRWNELHGVDTGRVAVMMPVNLRPAGWRTEVIGNFASYVTVSVLEEEQEELSTAIEAVAARTRRIKDQGLAGSIVDQLRVPTVMPAALKRRLQHLIPLTGNRVVATTVLSNLGRLPPLPKLGRRAGDAQAVWFSPPGRMPLGASVGAATVKGRLFVTLRYRPALFDAPAAGRFAALYRHVLLMDNPVSDLST